MKVIHVSEFVAVRMEPKSNQFCNGKLQGELKCQ